MATHFKGPILYSSARKGLENLQVGVWPDQAVFLDDFTGIVIDATNDWTVVKFRWMSLRKVIGLAVE